MSDIELTSKILESLKTKKWYNPNLSYFSVTTSNPKFILNDFLESINIDTSRNISLDIIFKNGFLVLDSFKEFYKAGTTIWLIFKNSFISVEWQIKVNSNFTKNELIFISQETSIKFITQDNFNSIKYSPYFYKPVIESVVKDTSKVTQVNTQKDQIDSFHSSVFEDESGDLHDEEEDDYGGFD